MKKLLAILASLVLLSVVSCDEKDGAASSNQLPDELSEINVASSCPLLKDAGELVIPIVLTPSSLSIPEVLKLSGGDEQVVTARLVKEGLAVTPVGSGTAVLTVSPKSGPAASRSVTVQVIDGIKSISISFNTEKGGEPLWLGSAARLSKGQKYYLEVVIVDNSGKSIQTPVTWSVSGGGIALSQEGVYGVAEVTEAGVYPAPVIKASPLVDPSRSVSLTANTFDAPSSICFEKDLVNVKLGVSKLIGVSVLPETAIQELYYKPETGLSLSPASAPSGGTFKNYYKLTASSSPSKLLSVSFASKVASSVTNQLKVDVCDFDENEVKVGDYVFVSQGGALRSADCGIRTTFGGYEDGVARRVSDVIKSGESFVGIIIKCGQASPSTLFMKDMLKPSGSTGLENDKSYFPGLSNSPNCHGLIIGEPIAEGSIWESGGTYHTKDLNQDLIGLYYTYYFCQTSPSSSFTIADEFYRYNPGRYTGLKWFIPGNCTSLLPLGEYLHVRKSFVAANMDLKRKALDVNSNEPTYVWAIADASASEAWAYRLDTYESSYKFEKAVKMNKNGSGSIIPVLFF